MTQPFDLLQLQRQLPAFDVHAPVAAGGAIGDYFAYYGLDVERRQPAVQHHFGYLLSGRYHIVCHWFRQPEARGTLFLFHGYFDHAGLYRHAIDHGLSRGFDVVIYDLPGHGLSTGERVSIGSFAEYETVLRDVLGQLLAHAPQPWHALAQSTGGAVLMDYLLLQTAPSFDKVVLLAPLVRAAEWRWVKAAHWLGHRFLERVPRRFGVNSSDPAFLDWLRRDPLQTDYISVRWVDAMLRWERRVARLPASDRQILLVQGEQDATVDWRYNIPVIREKFPRARYLPLKDAHHHLVNEAPAIREKIFAAIDIYWLADGL